MELSVTEIVKIIKSETNIIKREKAIAFFFLNLSRELMSLALERVDQELSESMRNRGYQIEKKNQRSINMAFGEATYVRRRYVKAGQESRYPLDKFMGFDKYKYYSVLVVRNILEVSSVAAYRNTALAVNYLSGFNISHAQIGNLVKTAGQKIKEQQETDSRYDAQTAKKRVPVLCLEGNGVMIKGTQDDWSFIAIKFVKDYVM
ncbi:hypothetical protein CDA64_00375 [Lactobacillus helveticus]|nr:hypothetical protein CDA64_00375 [Lactobacillus helveticus]